MSKLYITESGRKREAEQFLCQQCGKLFLRRKRKQKLQAYCTLACKNLARQSRITLVCQNCGKEFTRIPSKMKIAKHGYQFCSRKCKDYAQSINGTCNAIKPTHYGQANYIYNAKHLLDRVTNPRCDCGEARIYCLIVHHIDGDRTNNHDSNLEVVCGTCHMLRHLKPSGTSWEYDSKYLTPRDLLSRL